MLWPLGKMWSIEAVLLYNGAALLILSHLDWLLKRYTAAGRHSTRWFRLHSLANIIIATAAHSDVMDCLQDPARSSETTSTEWARAFALSLHIYHALAFHLRSEDWWHHVISVYICAPVCIVNDTKAFSVNYFFCTGAPGAIDYAALSLVRSGHIPRLTQKRLGSYLNAYVRMPGGCYGAYLIARNAFSAPGGWSPGLAATAMILYVNSAHYGRQAIASSAAAEAVARLKPRTPIAET